VRGTAPEARPGRLVLRVPDGVRRAMESEARARYPHECVGALLGRAGEDGGRRVERAVPVRNERASERERRYLVGPRRIIELDGEAEAEGLEILGFFHSHPDHPPRPSEFDREHAWPWYSYVIVPVREGEPGEPRAWRLRDDRSRFDEEEILFEE